MKESNRTYLPAAGRDWLLPLYDPIAKLLGVDSDRRKLLDQSAIQPGSKILDIGCGTGSLILLIKQLYTNVEVAGLDPDPNTLARARRKTNRAGLTVRFDKGFSSQLPYPDKIFDRVFSTFMFHHLEPDDKIKTLHEVNRVLKKGGSFYLLDFAHLESYNSRESSFLSRWIHSSHRLENNSEELVLSQLVEAGFVDSKKVSQRKTFFARIAGFRATAP